MQFDGGTQSDVDERLFALRAAARKHNTQVAELSNLLLQITAQLELIDTSQVDLLTAEKACAQAWQHYEDLAQQLFAMRQKAALVLAKAVQAELPALKMDKAQFVVGVQILPQSQWGADGCDTVQFLVATNQGTQAAPLAKIASGGEMARFMLALKLVCRAVEPVPSLIFDEVDTGIGGAVAAAVGQRLQTLGQLAQVFVVTHAPQVATYAHQHWVVAKATQNAKVTTSVRPLNATERVQELARMLSGSDITTAATLAAQSLLDDAHSQKNQKKKTA
jgi:DNA repair protein RecN (Recombination protein N)